MSDQTIIIPGNRPVEGNNAFLIYILYLVSFIVGITALIGLVMAYVYQDNAPAWVRTHYRFQIRTFWIGLLYGLIGGALVFAFVGILVLAFVVVWYIVRCVKGMQRVNAGLPYENVTTWLW